jgi:hypothetical protein
MSNEESQPEPPIWFAGRTACRRSHFEEGVQKVHFEERIVMVLAKTADEAEDKVWAEARQYAAQSADYELLPGCAVYCTMEYEFSEGMEVWSVLREERLDPFAYEAKHYANEVDSTLDQHFEHSDTAAGLKARHSSAWAEARQSAASRAEAQVTTGQERPSPEGA